MGIEKSGRILLLEEDIDEFQKGQVSQRVFTNWGLTLEELSSIIQSQHYVLVSENKQFQSHQ